MGVPGREVVQNAEHPVAMAFVAFRRLEAESLQKNMSDAAPPGFLLGGRQQPLTKTLAAQVFPQPQQVDMQSLVIGVTDDATEHLSCRILDDKA